MAAALACTALGAYIFTRCDRRLAVAAALVYQLGSFCLLLGRLVGLAAMSAEQAALQPILEIAGTVVAAAAGALFAALVAFPQREGWRAAGFAVLAALTLASAPGIAGHPRTGVAPSAPAHLSMATALYVFLARRRLFPELTANVLDAAVFDQRDAVLVFDRAGALVDASTPDLAGAVSFDGMTGMADFVDRVRRSTVSGGFFSLDEISAMDPRGMAREVSLAGPEGTRHYLALANPVQRALRSRVGCVCGFYDITDQKSLEAELVARTAELADVNAALARSLTAAERLESERARQAAAAEVRGTLGGRIEELLAAIDSGTEAGELVAGCRAVLGQVRSTVAALFPGSAGKGTRA